MMMRMLEAGGLPVAIDNHRPADEDNPHGYYEFEPAKRLREDASWLAPLNGKAVKIVYLLLYDLPRDHEYRVVLMHRRLDEVVASQRVMLQRQRKAAGPVPDAQLARMLSSDLQRLDGWIRQQENFRVLHVSYDDLLSHPEATAIAVERFLGLGLNTNAMVTVVDRSLHRQRR